MHFLTKLAIFFFMLQSISILTFRSQRQLFIVMKQCIKYYTRQLIQVIFDNVLPVKNKISIDDLTPFTPSQTLSCLKYVFNF